MADKLLFLVKRFSFFCTLNEKVIWQHTNANNVEWLLMPAVQNVTSPLRMAYLLLIMGQQFKFHYALLVKGKLNRPNVVGRIWFVNLYHSGTFMHCPNLA